MKNLIALLLALAAFTASAQEMRVDVIVFKVTGTTAAPGAWEAAHELPPCDAVLLRTGGGAEAAFSQGQSDCSPRANREVLAGGLNLVDAAPLAEHVNRLRRAGYVVLASQSWRQASLNGAPVLLRAGATAAGAHELQGTVAVSGDERLANVELSLTLQNMSAETPLFSALRETRRIKPGELHYFDHSLFGALVRVTAP